jgi:uncharacterized membrane protein (UPF0136 family)
MKPMYPFFIAALAGAICGVLSTHGLVFLQWWSLLFWALVGGAVGYFCANRKQAIWAGLIYGFVLSVAFLLSGFQGSSDQFPAFAALSLALSVIGAIGGAISSFVGYWIREVMR